MGYRRLPVKAVVVALASLSACQPQCQSLLGSSRLSQASSRIHGMSQREKSQWQKHILVFAMPKVFDVSAHKFLVVFPMFLPQPTERIHPKRCGIFSLLCSIVCIKTQTVA